MGNFIKAKVCGDSIVAQMRKHRGDGVLAKAVIAGDASMSAMDEFLAQRDSLAKSSGIPLSFIASTCCAVGVDMATGQRIRAPRPR